MHSLVFLQEHARERDNTKTSTYGQNLVVSVDPIDGVNIYLKALTKLSELLNSLEQNIAQLSGRNTDKEVQLRSKIAEDYLKFKAICEEFLKGFSVVHDESIKDAAFLIYRTFSFLLTQIDLVYISKKLEHTAPIKHYIGKLEELFNQMLGILSPESKVTTSQDEVNNVSTTNTDTEIL